MPKIIKAPVEIGEIIAEKYRVEQILGAGAMGVVVAARHVDLHELRAIKFMLPEALEDDTAVERFVREARSVVKLKSAHVAKVHDVGKLANGSPYIVMEHLEGKDLRSLAKERGPLPVEEVARYVIEACEAVEEAHENGIIHRDIKPANLFLAKGLKGMGTIKVLDFGVAKLAKEASGEDAVELTKTASMVGTPAFMSPEQMRARKKVDGRSDIWALGVVLYRLVSGKMPFLGGDVTEICTSVLWDQPMPLGAHAPGLPDGFEAVVLRCLEKEPAMRFQTAGELAAALAPFASFTGASIAPSISAPAAPSPLRAGGPPTEALPAPKASASQSTAEASATGTGAATAPPWTQGSSAPQAKRAPWGTIAASAGVVLAGSAVAFIAISGGGRDATSFVVSSSRPSASAIAAPPMVEPAQTVAQPALSAPLPIASASASGAAIEGDAGAPPTGAPSAIKPKPRSGKLPSNDAFGNSRH